MPPDVEVWLICRCLSSPESTGYLHSSSVHVSVCYPHAGTDDVWHHSISRREIFSLYQ